MNEAELLFTEILGCDRASLCLHKDAYLDHADLGFIALALKRRIKGEPIQYILGKAEFMGLEFRVDKNALIPRPETEILVETALESAHQSISSSGHQLKVLDLGTGSGCIAVSLAKYSPNLEIDASDISVEALKVAGKNAVLNKVKINFIQGDLFANPALPPAGYDMIVTNPPYVAASQIKELQPELRFEPEIALNGGKDGLDFFRRIISDAPAYLKKGGLLIMETGFGQHRAIEKIFNSTQALEIIKIVKDYNGINRVIVAKRR